MTHDDDLSTRRVHFGRLAAAVEGSLETANTFRDGVNAHEPEGFPGPDDSRAHHAAHRLKDQWKPFLHGVADQIHGHHRSLSDNHALLRRAEGLNETEANVVRARMPDTDGPVIA